MSPNRDPPFLQRHTRGIAFFLFGQVSTRRGPAFPNAFTNKLLTTRSPAKLLLQANTLLTRHDNGATHQTSDLRMEENYTFRHEICFNSIITMSIPCKWIFLCKSKTSQFQLCCSPRRRRKHCDFHATPCRFHLASWWSCHEVGSWR